MKTVIVRGVAGAVAALAMSWSVVSFADSGKTLIPVTMVTSWYAQAEHGGYYEAKALGLYKKHGLDVTIKMGGPQVNTVQLVMGGAADFSMGYSLQTLNAVKQGVPLVSVAAFFQKDPQSLIVHDGQGINTLADLKGVDIRIPTAGRVAYWPWLKTKYGFTDSQLRPYDYTLGPFIANKKVAQQGYITNDGYFLKQQHVAAKSLLLANYGWDAYSCTLDTTRKMIKEHPEVVQAMVTATAEGWAAYFKNPAPGNALIQKANPQKQGLIDYSVEAMRNHGIVLSGAAAKGDRYGLMTGKRWKDFYQQMVKAGTLPKGLDYQKAYDLKFIQSTYAKH